MEFSCLNYLWGVRKFRRMCAVIRRVVRWIVSNDILSDISFMCPSIPCVTLSNAPITTGIVCIFLRFQHFCSSISKSRYLVVFSASFRTMFCHTGIATSIILHSRFLSSCMIISGLLYPTFCPY